MTTLRVERMIPVGPNGTNLPFQAGKALKAAQTLDRKKLANPDYFMIGETAIVN